jgi:hypothetical protein
MDAATAMAAAPVAPARGPQVLEPEYEIVTGGTRRRVSAHWRAADVFDAMDLSSRADYLRRLGDDVDWVPPFTPGQVAMARLYRDMTERHGAGGMRGSSLDGGGSGGGEFIDAHITLGDRLRGLHQSIGSGAALPVRRVRPSTRGKPGARVISDRTLVDALCLHGMGLNAVLRAAGWSSKSDHRVALRSALAAALDRMQGYASHDGAK